MSHEEKVLTVFVVILIIVAAAVLCGVRHHNSAKAAQLAAQEEAERVRPMSPEERQETIKGICRVFERELPFEEFNGISDIELRAFWKKTAECNCNSKCDVVLMDGRRPGHVVGARMFLIDSAVYGVKIWTASFLSLANFCLTLQHYEDAYDSPEDVSRFLKIPLRDAVTIWRLSRGRDRD